MPGYEWSYIPLIISSSRKGIVAANLGIGFARIDERAMAFCQQRCKKQTNPGSVAGMMAHLSNAVNDARLTKKFSRSFCQLPCFFKYMFGRFGMLHEVSKSLLKSGADPIDRGTS